MRAILFCAAGVIFCWPLLAVSDASEAAAEMRNIEAQLDRGEIAPVVAALPEQWTISTPEGSYTISSKVLRDLIAQTPRGSGLPRAKEWLDHLAAHLDGSAVTPRASGNAHQELTRILARREFDSVRPPSQWELLQERIRNWLGRFFQRLFGFAAQYPTESKIFFWTLIGGAVLAFLVWLFRRWDRAELLSMNIPSDTTLRTSNQWIVAARAFSADGDFRKAIQCTYWAAIVRLEEIGRLPRNRPHTPREYLSLVTTSRGGEPSPIFRAARGSHQAVGALLVCRSAGFGARLCGVLVRLGGHWMPGGLEASDRKLLLGAGAVAILLVAGTFALAPPARSQQTGVPSSYASDSGGALAAYLLLVNLHYEVHRWEESPANLKDRGSSAVLVLAEPSDLPTDPERQALRAFVTGGGRLLFCGPELKSFFPEAATTPFFKSGWQDSTARIPSYVSHNASTITLEREARWGEFSPEQLTLYGDADGPTVVAWRMGAGEILWWAGATPLTNAGLPRAGNLQLFLNTVSNPAPLTVYWDEYFHGQRASLWSYFEGTPVPWGILQAFVITRGDFIYLQPPIRAYREAGAGFAVISPRICGDGWRSVSKRPRRVSGGGVFPIAVCVCKPASGWDCPRQLRIRRWSTRPRRAWVGMRARLPILWRRRPGRSICRGCGPLKPWLSCKH